ncbi:hypothetical protein QTP86_030050, partial [Hemibagrus guttatus]
MDGSWTADGELSHGVADNTPSKALTNTNDVYIQCGKVIIEGSHGGRWDGDVPNVCTQSLHCKGPVSRIQGIASEVASSSSSSSSTSTYTHNVSRDVSPDCQEIPSGTSPESKKHPSMGSLLNIPEDSIERKKSVTSNMYNSVNNQFPAATQQQTAAQYLDPLFGGSSLNDKESIETSCEILKRCSSLGFYDSTEVCSLAQSKTTEETHFPRRPCLSDELGPVGSNMENVLQ